MSYTPRVVVDHETIFNKELYDNLQDGIDEGIIADQSRRLEIQTVNQTLNNHGDEILVMQGDIEDHEEKFDDIDIQIEEIWSAIGGQGSATVTASNTSGWISKSFSSTQSVPVSFTWSSIEEGIPTGDGSITIAVNNVKKIAQTVHQGSLSYDLKSYMSNGTNNIKVTIADTYGTKKSFKLTAYIVSLTCTSTYDFGVVRTGATQFNCTIKGSVTKTFYCSVDGVTIYTDTTESATKAYAVSIPDQTHGVHTIRAWCTATIDGSTITSDIIVGKTIWYHTADSVVLKIDEPEEDEYNQYDLYTFSYQLYSDNALTRPIRITMGNELIVDETVDRTVHTVSRRLKTYGTVTFTLTSGEDASGYIELTVAQNDLPVTVETQGLQMNLTAQGKSQSLNPDQWTDAYGTTTTFNHTPTWDTSDYIEGTSLLLDNNSAVISKKLFQEDWKQNGKTIEFDFKIEDSTDTTETVISCMSGGIGFKVTGTTVTLYSQDLMRQAVFNADERNTITFVVEPTTLNRFVHTYVNGVWSGVVQYATTDIFSQSTPVDITLSAQNCKLRIYNLRAYTTALDRTSLLDNHIASFENVDTLLEYYGRCDIMTNGEVDRTKIGVPYMILKTVNEGEVLPQYKKDYKYIDVWYIDQEDETRNWTATGVQINVG